jgi:hypothetical protein
MSPIFFVFVKIFIDKTSASEDYKGRNYLLKGPPKKPDNEDSLVKVPKLCLQWVENHRPISRGALIWVMQGRLDLLCLHAKA